MMTLDYSSNGEELDLYLEASGRAVDFRGDILMIAQGFLPHSSWNNRRLGDRIASSGDGVDSLYKANQFPSAPGLCQQNRISWRESKSATIHLYRGPYEYPVVLDDITSGGFLPVRSAVQQDTTWISLVIENLIAEQCY